VARPVNKSGRLEDLYKVSIVASMVVLLMPLLLVKDWSKMVVQELVSWWCAGAVFVVE
jgi:hypothetical protein